MIPKKEISDFTLEDIGKLTLKERQQIITNIRKSLERNRDPDLDKRIETYGRLTYGGFVSLDGPVKKKPLDPNYESFIRFFPMQLFSNGRNMIEYTNPDETIKTTLARLADDRYTLSVVHAEEDLDSIMEFRIADETVIFNEKMKSMEEIGFSIMLQIIKDNQLEIKDYPAPEANIKQNEAEAECIWMNLNRRFVKTGLISKHGKQFSCVTCPPGTTVNGQELSWHQFYPMSVRENPFNPSCLSVLMPPQVRLTWTNLETKEKQEIMVESNALKEGIYENYRNYREKNKAVQQKKNSAPQV